jgi:hypothetical protein
MQCAQPLTLGREACVRFGGRGRQAAESALEVARAQMTLHSLSCALGVAYCAAVAA